MIISAPTALYNSVLPKTNDDPTAVSWTISSQDPPRSTQTLFQLLRSEQLRTLPPLIYTDKERRQSFGELIFRVMTAGQDDIGSGTKSFEIGQTLDFDDIQEPSDIVDLNVPDRIELQQNTNILDLTSIGLSNEQSEQLVSSATEQFKDLIINLNSTNNLINVIKADIDANQKLINETRKARDAAKIVFAGSTDQPIVDILNSKEAQLLLERDALIGQLNQLSGDANEIYNRILDIREVVR